MKTTLVQITDSHLTDRADIDLYGVDTEATLRHVISAIRQLPDKPQLAIVTGDLVETGSAASYVRATKILESLALPVYVLPGNHDDASIMRSTIDSELISTAKLARAGNWLCVMVDSQVDGEAYGRVSANELLRVRALLEKEPDTPVLIALHHTPSEICPAPGCQLHNVAEFTTLLSEYRNVKAVIAGHTHGASEVRNGHYVQYTTPSTFAQVRHALPGSVADPDDFWASHQLDGERQGFRVLDLYDDGHIESKVHWVGAGNVVS